MAVPVCASFGHPTPDIRGTTENGIFLPFGDTPSWLTGAREEEEDFQAVFLGNGRLGWWTELAIAPSKNCHSCQLVVVVASKYAKLPSAFKRPKKELILGGRRVTKLCLAKEESERFSSSSSSSCSSSFLLVVLCQKL